MNKSGALIFILGAVLFFPFLGNVHLFDWDEINFAESAREMLVTGDFFRVQINFRPFWEKPPLFFWLQVLSMKTFGVNEFAARFPNAVCGILSLLMIHHIGRKYFNERFGWLWVLFITGSITPHLYFKSGIIDPWFNLFIFLSVFQFFLASQKETPDERTKHFVLMSIFNGLAILTKGPVALLILVLCVIVFLVVNRFRIFFTIKDIVFSILIISAITSVWFINELIKNGPSVLTDFIVYQIELFTKPVAGHGQPWYYHPVVLLFGAFPASVFAIRGFFIKNNNATQKPFLLMMNILFWVVLILFSITTTKIVHYSSLCYLPLTFFAALATDKYIKEKAKPNRKFNITFLLIAIIIVSLLMTLPFIDVIKENIIPYIKDPFAVACLSVNAPWNGYEPSIALLMAIIIITYLIAMSRNQITIGILVLLSSFSILIPIYLMEVAPKIEVYSQAPAIKFYQSIAGQDSYCETLGFKSYAQYFYTKCKPQSNSNYTDKGWLLSGNIDKPVYFVVKVNELEEYKKYNLTELKREGGFVFLKREVQ